MNPQDATDRRSAVERGGGTRNPFGVMDVPEPCDQGVQEFAAGAKLAGVPDDENAEPWASQSDHGQQGTIEGSWSSRWNGGADPTIPGDTVSKWKRGRAEVRMVEDCVYILFDWSDGARRGLIDARREGTTRLIGKYINLIDPRIMRPWVGLIVGDQRIDGRWPGGRLDFRR